MSSRPPKPLRFLSMFMYCVWKVKREVLHQVKQHKLLKIRKGCFGTCFMEHTLVQNVGPYFCLFANHIVCNCLLVTILVNIVFVECSSDLRVILLLSAFLVGTALMQTSCCLSNSVVGQYCLHS